MIWIIEKFKRGLAQLRHWETWVVIVLLGLFVTLAYHLGRMALWTDSKLSELGIFSHACRQLNNGLIIGLFGGMIFFLFTAVLSLGEVQRYIQFNRRGATYQARWALIRGGAWGLLAAIIAITGLFFFSTICR
ncbi:MAG: hypothetical protein FWF20_04810 [Betaproteobacteria bacterium]|nr:hypothetical protein [Betaproteobacteria bacterium]MCL2886099.1 hypothetical protein [Betaproteobacteria bacterium]